MTASAQLTRIRLQKGRHLVKRGEVWYLETCTEAQQRRRSLGTSDLEEATRLAVIMANVAPEGTRASTTSSPSTVGISMVGIQEGDRLHCLVPAALPPSTFIVMLAIGRGVAHGYSIMGEIGLLSGGALRMGPGTLYRSLLRMLAAGFIEEVSGAGRKSDVRRRYYRLSKHGLSSARRESVRLERLVNMAKSRGLA